MKPAGGVAPAVAGPVRVRSEDLEGKLGHAAWLLLLILWTRRDPQTGQTTTTDRGLLRAKGFQRLASGTMKRALGLLRRVGLLRSAGWCVRNVPAGPARVTRPVFVRVVYGAAALALVGSPATCFVPQETAAWMTTAPMLTRGGLRRGAGRKPHKNVDGFSNGSRSELGFVGKSYSNGSTPYSNGSTPSEFKRILDLDLLISGCLDGRSDPSLRSGCRREDAPMLAILDPERGSPDQTPRTTSDPTPGSSRTRSTPKAPRSPKAGSTVGEGREVVPSERTPLGARLASGRALPGELPSTPRKGVPPFPGAGLIPSATVPEPPLVDPEMRPMERVHMLTDAYRAAVESRYKQTSNAFRHAVKPKGSKPLIDAAQVLIDHEFAPAAWAAWSIDVWRMYAAERGGSGANKPPPITWVFGAKRIHEKRGWFAAEESGYSGGRVILGPKHRALHQQYMEMRNAIAREAGRGDPSTVVARYFPSGSFERLVAEARDEAQQIQRGLEERVAQGEFLWGTSKHG